MSRGMTEDGIRVGTDERYAHLALTAVQQGKTIEWPRFYALLVRAARYGVAVSGRRVAVEDVTQELWLWVDRRIARIYSPERGCALALLRQYARYIAMGLGKRTAGRPSPEGMIDGVIFREVEGEVAGGVEIPDYAALVDVAHALEQVERSSGGKGKRFSSPVRRQSEGDGSYRELGDGHRELKRIRQRLEMTQRQFAMTLGVSVALISAYEQGRTRKVNPRLLTAARALLAE